MINVVTAFVVNDKLSVRADTLGTGQFIWAVAEVAVARVGVISPAVVNNIAALAVVNEFVLFTHNLTVHSVPVEALFAFHTSTAEVRVDCAMLDVVTASVFMGELSFRACALGTSLHIRVIAEVAVARIGIINPTVINTRAALSVVQEFVLFANNFAERAVPVEAVFTLDTSTTEVRVD